MDKKVSIILLNYKGTKDTLSCVESLEKIEYDNFEIIIVENDSPDDSYEVLSEAIGNKHTLIKSPSNGGFAKGNNIGINYALEKGTDFVLLLNNDTLVEKDFLREMINCYHRNEAVGMVGCKILYESRRDLIWYGGGELNLKRFYGLHHGEGQKDCEEFNIEKEVTFNTGCVMLIPKEVIEKVGTLPEEYFLYYEDVDYSLSVQEAGYKIFYCPKAVVYHKVSASTGGEESPFAVEWNTRNRIIFMNKFKHKVNKLEFLKAKSFFYSTRIIKLLQYKAKGQEEKAKALKVGIRKGKAFTK
jgi:GT2 family glycosyltransferase